MPRKTAGGRNALMPDHYGASMRPRPDATENAIPLLPSPVRRTLQ